MKNFTLLIFISVLLIACNRDESTLNDYELFGRLQSGSGTWEIVSITTKDNADKSSEKQDITPDDAFYHFYLKTVEISGVLVDKNYAVRYTDGSPTKASDIEAEPLRVVFTNGQVLGGEVWTVKINKPRTQEWVFVSGSTTTTMLLEKCNCEIPKPTISEQGG